MKTAISIPDKIYETAEKLANRLGQSRSQLYTEALVSYVERHQDDTVTAKLNEIYDTEDTTVDPVLFELQTQSLLKNTW